MTALLLLERLIDWVKATVGRRYQTAMGRPERGDDRFDRADHPSTGRSK